jgi:hypothetical protein
LAAILNFLRAENEGNQSEISQEDVMQVAKKYNQRTSPWSTEELNLQKQGNQ